MGTSLTHHVTTQSLPDLTAGIPAPQGIFILILVGAHAAAPTPSTSHRGASLRPVRWTLELASSIIPAASDPHVVSGL